MWSWRLRWGRHCQRERGKPLKIYDRPSKHKGSRTDKAEECMFDCGGEKRGDEGRQMQMDGLLGQVLC